MKRQFWVNYAPLLTFQACARLRSVALMTCRTLLTFFPPVPSCVFGPLPPLPVPLPVPGDGNWWTSEAVNTSQSFHVIDGLQPGAVYTVRLLAKGLLDNASIFEDVIQTRVKGERRESIAARRYDLARQTGGTPPSSSPNHTSPLRGSGLPPLAKIASE